VALLAGGLQIAHLAALSLIAALHKPRLFSRARAWDSPLDGLPDLVLTIMLTCAGHTLVCPWADLPSLLELVLFLPGMVLVGNFLPLVAFSQCGYIMGSESRRLLKEGGLEL
jgi:hypothetical protein